MRLGWLFSYSLCFRFLQFIKFMMNTRFFHLWFLTLWRSRGKMDGTGMMYIIPAFYWCLDRTFWLPFEVLHFGRNLEAHRRRRWLRWLHHVQFKSGPYDLISRCNQECCLLWLLFVSHVHALTVDHHRRAP
jgi:hypothetical protein